jgi:hypothetical protein
MPACEVVHLHDVGMPALDDCLTVLAEIGHVDGRMEVLAGLGVVGREEFRSD